MKQLHYTVLCVVFLLSTSVASADTVTSVDFHGASGYNHGGSTFQAPALGDIFPSRRHRDTQAPSFTPPQTHSSFFDNGGNHENKTLPFRRWFKPKRGFVVPDFIGDMPRGQWGHRGQWPLPGRHDKFPYGKKPHKGHHPSRAIPSPAAFGAGLSLLAALSLTRRRHPIAS